MKREKVWKTVGVMVIGADHGVWGGWELVQQRAPGGAALVFFRGSGGVRYTRVGFFNARLYVRFKVP